MAKKSAEPIPFFSETRCGPERGCASGRMGAGTFAVLTASGDDVIRGEIAWLGLLVGGGFENAAYDLKYHLRGLAVQIFYRVRSASGDADASNRFFGVSSGRRSFTDVAVIFNALIYCRGWSAGASTNCKGLKIKMAEVHGNRTHA